MKDATMLPQLTPAGAKLLQAALKDAGWYRGEINGDIDRQTKSALRMLQHDRKLRITGEPNEQTLTSLGILERLALMKQKNLQKSRIQKKAA